MLNRYTVLDLTDQRGEIGPMLLGDLGADVIRIETPEGSDARRAAPFQKESPEDLKSLQFIAFNRNKRSIALDPTNNDDKIVFEKLIKRADFIFTSRDSTEAAAFNLSYDLTRTLNPKIVHVLISAFGNDGPHADLLGNDLVIAAMGGPVALQGIPGRAPIRISVPQVWRHTGVEAAAGGHGRPSPYAQNRAVAVCRCLCTMRDDLDHA